MLTSILKSRFQGLHSPELSAQCHPMTDMRFYHLLTQSPDRALPQILGRALTDGRRAVVKLPDAREVERVCDLLWTFQPDSFLPHGTEKDGNGPDQPVWLTAGDDNPAGADILVLTGGTQSARIEDYALCCLLFDGRDPAALAQARAVWKDCKDAGHDLTYWQQNEKGGWDRK